MDWGETWNLQNEATPQEAYRLGKMVAAMVEASLATVYREAVHLNVEAFRTGLADGLAQSGIDATPLQTAPIADVQADGTVSPDTAQLSDEMSSALRQKNIRKPVADRREHLHAAVVKHKGQPIT